MTDPIKTGDGTGKDAVITPGVTDTTKTDTGAGVTGNVDTSKFTQADWDKIYSDPKLYENPRFKGLNEQAKQAKILSEQVKKAEETKLIEQKKWEELANKREVENKTLQGQIQASSVNNAIIMEAGKQGVIDSEAVTKLIDKSSIKTGEDGTVTGVAEAVKALIIAKPYLAGKGNRNVDLGSGSNPNGDDTTTPRFTHSQIRDPIFYRKHEREIQKALALGLVRDDLAKSLT